MWAQGRPWLWRLVLLFWFAWILIRHLADPMYSSILGNLNLGVHELGHLLFMPFGRFLCTLGGTLLQCSLPLFGIYNFYREGDYFAILLCFGWLSDNLFDVARYVADARALELPLVNLFGGSVEHDWNVLLGSMGILQFDTTIAFLIKCAAVLLMLLCLGLGGWLLRQMNKKP